MQGGVAVLVRLTATGAGQQQLWNRIWSRRRAGCYWNNTKTRSSWAKGPIKRLRTENGGFAPPSCHHQWGATRLVGSVDGRVVRQQQLHTIDMTWERCSVEWSPAMREGGNDQVCRVLLIQLLHWLQITWSSWTWTLTPIHASYLPLASLQLVISDPMASNSSDAQFSWSFIL